MTQFREGLIRLEPKLVILLIVATASAWAQGGGYSGPQILNRGSGMAGDRPGGHTGIHYYAGVSENYEVGLLPAATDSNGKIFDQGGLFSVWANWGVYGRKQYRRTTLGLDYEGTFRHYPTEAAKVLLNNGVDHTFRMSVTHQNSKSTAFNLDLSAGSVSRFYAANSLQLSPAMSLSSANYSLFDSRAYFVDATGGLAWKINSRWTFGAQGLGFAVDHKVRPLIGLQGYGVLGLASYRIDARDRLDFTYRFQHIDYMRGFGESDSDVYLAGITRRVSRRWTTTFTGGAARVQAVGLQSIAADPISQALFGATTVVQAYHVDQYTAAFNVEVRADYRDWTIMLTGSQLPSAGNGLYMTSNQRQGFARIGYIAIRKASFGAFYTYNSLSSFGQTSLGTTNYSSGGGDASYKLSHAFDISARFDARRIQVDAAKGFIRNGYLVSVGLNFHPNDIPLSW